jgi:hypothetical protein
MLDEDAEHPFEMAAVEDPISDRSIAVESVVEWPS